MNCTSAYAGAHAERAREGVSYFAFCSSRILIVFGPLFSTIVGPPVYQRLRLGCKLDDVWPEVKGYV